MPRLTGVDVLGRLLVAGTLGGAVVGALVGVVVAAEDWRPWGGAVVLVAAVLGTVAGPLVQVVTATAVLSLRAVRPRRVAAVGVPVLGALVLPLAGLTRMAPVGTTAVVAVAVSVASTALLAVRLRPWCLGD